MVGRLRLEHGNGEVIQDLPQSVSRLLVRIDDQRAVSLRTGRLTLPVMRRRVEAPSVLKYDADRVLTYSMPLKRPSRWLVPSLAVSRQPARSMQPSARKSVNAAAVPWRRSWVRVRAVGARSGADLPAARPMHHGVRALRTPELCRRARARRRKRLSRVVALGCIGRL